MNYIAIPGLTVNVDNKTAQRVLFETARVFGISVNDMVSKCRQRNLVDARNIAMYLIREHTGMTLLEIAKCMGGRDHTTAIHGIGAISTELKLNRELRMRKQQIEAIL